MQVELPELTPFALKAGPRGPRDGDGDGVGGAVLRVFPCGTYATKTVSSPLVAKS